MLAFLQDTDSRLRAFQESEVLQTDFWFGLGAAGLRIVVIALLAFLVLGIVARLKGRWIKRVQNLPTLDKKRQRVLTVADLMGSIAKYVVWSIALIMILAAMSLDIGPLLAGAGIAGLAIGFGAQTLVKDVISGLFLLFDDTLGVGDLITHGGETGTVEYVGLRLIKVRKFDGELLMIPAGELRTFGNKSIGYARVIVQVGLSYEQNVNEALAALNAVAQEWAQTEEAQRIMLEEAPLVQAVTDLADSAVTARVVVQVQPGEQFPAERELRRLIKQRFDERGIEIPFPRRTVYIRSEGSVTPEEAAAAGA
jgi:moderate conductance mechanosensitive channel